jgi:hypothetical protein
MQTTHTENVAIGRVGQIADSRIMRHVKSRLADSGIQAGCGVFRVPGFGDAGDTTRMVDPGQIYQLTQDSQAAVVNAFKTSGASAAGIQVITVFDGTFADHDLHPARKATLILSNHADWDATTAVAKYVNQEGKTVTENLAIPNTGNATVTTTGFVRRWISLTIPAQSGAGGTYTIGAAILDASVVLSDFVGIAMYDAAHFSARGASPLLAAGQTFTEDTAAEYAAFESVPVVEKGAVWVRSEDACSEGAAVFVRIVGGVPGRFRSDADGRQRHCRDRGAKWGRDSLAGRPQCRGALVVRSVDH